MTAATAVAPGDAVRWPVAAVGVAAAGCALLMGRPFLLAGPVDPVVVLVLVFCGLLAVGATWPVPAERRCSTAVLVRVTAVGVATFAAGRVLGGGHPPQPAVLRLMALNALAAVAEEAFFRRFVYTALLPGGAALAVGGSAVLFAVVHVSVYGMWVLPIDIAAGLVLSWQRWATGSWFAPTLTHCLANVLVVI